MTDAVTTHPDWIYGYWEGRAEAMKEMAEKVEKYFQHVHEEQPWDCGCFWCYHQNYILDIEREIKALFSHSRPSYSDDNRETGSIPQGSQEENAQLETNVGSAVEPRPDKEEEEYINKHVRNLSTGAHI